MPGPEHATHDVDLFVERAQAFCDFVEKSGEYSLQERLSNAQQCLLELYKTALMLPYAKVTNDRDADALPVLPSIDFDKYDFYYVVFDAYVEDEPVGGSLADDFRDIYRDLQEGFALWKHESTRNNAIWDWRFGFDTHWGRHAIHALGALHDACNPLR